ncbi:hypothetical protein COI08_06840 [Neisseria meningitidis]|nr:hypothetical protein COI08_06840 [Neisseria meningitidis]
MTASVCRLQHGFFRFYVLDSRLRGNDGGAVSVFSDKFLKLKISSFPQEQKPTNRNLKSRHSRAGGNPDLSVRTLIG